MEEGTASLSYRNKDVFPVRITLINLTLSIKSQYILLGDRKSRRYPYENDSRELNVRDPNRGTNRSFTSAPLQAKTLLKIPETLAHYGKRYKRRVSVKLKNSFGRGGTVSGGKIVEGHARIIPCR